MRKRQRYSKSRRSTWSRGRGRNSTSRRRTSTRKSSRRTTRRTARRSARRSTTTARARFNKPAWKNNNSKNTPKSKPSPFAKSFISGVKSGQPTFTVINNIAKRTGKSFNTICQSLVTSGVCRGQKFNGQWICWPNFNTRTNNASSKQAQRTLWQGFVDWCITSGNCSYKSLNSKSGNQAHFTKSLQSLLNRQCNLSGTSKVKPGKSTTWSKTYNLPTWSSTYAFPAFRNGTYSRRWAKAA